MDNLLNAPAPDANTAPVDQNLMALAQQMASSQSAPQETSSSSDSEDPLMTMAKQMAAQGGDLKKQDPDTYQEQVTKAALNPDYDPVNQTAVDKIDGKNTKDFNFDVYNARHLKGIETKIPITQQLASAIDNLPQGLADSFANSGFLNRLAESVYQSAPMFTPIGWVAAANGINPELPSISGRTQNENVAENLSSIDTAWQRTFGIAHSFLDNLKQDFGTSYKKMDDNGRSDFFDTRVNDELRMENAARGQGFLNKDIAGFDKEKINPNDVKRDSTFMPIDPLQMAFMKIAPIAGMAGKAGLEGLANKIPEGLVQGLKDSAQTGIGRGLQGIARVGGSPAVAGIGYGALRFAEGDDLGTAALKGFTAAAVGKTLGSSFGAVGKYLEGTLPAGEAIPLSVSAAEKAWQGAKAIYNSPEGQNAMGAAMFAAPLIYAENDPNKKVAIMTNSLAAGAAMGTYSRLGGLLDARYASNKNAEFYNSIPSTPGDYHTQYDMPNNEAVSRMSQQQRDMLYRARNFVGAENNELYVLPTDAFKEQVQNNAQQYFQRQGASPEDAANMAKNVNAGAVYYGADESGKPITFYREDAFTPDIMSHEVGHFIENTISDSVNEARQKAQALQAQGQPIPSELQSKLDLGSKLDASIPTGRARTVAEKTYIEQLYDMGKLKKQIDAVQQHVNDGNTGLQPRLDDLNSMMDFYKNVHKNGLSDSEFRSEWLAEQFSLTSRGLMSGEQPGKAATFKNGLGTFLDKVAPNAISQYMTTRQTPLGFRPSFVAGDIFDNWVSDRAKQMANEPSIPANSTTAPEISKASAPVAVDPEIMKTAESTLVGLQVPKRQALARVTEAVESLRKQGVDVSQIKLQDIIKESLRSQADAITQNKSKPIDQSEVKPPSGVVAPPPPPPTEPPASAPTPEEPNKPKYSNLRVTPEETPPYQNTKAEGLDKPLDVREMAGTHNNENGLKTATKREVQDDLSVSTKNESFLKGSKIDLTNPDEVKLVKQATEHADDPAAFQQALKTVQDAIANGSSTSIAYDSAANEIEGVASKSNRSNAQNLSNLDLLPRQGVQKTINPYNISVRTLDEPYMTGNAHAEALQNIKDFKFSNRMTFKTPEAATAALQELFVAKQEGRVPNLKPGEINFLYEKILPSQLRTRMYSNNFSFDKFMGNKKLLTRAIMDSGLQNDPEMARALDFMNSSTFEKDAIGRLNNIASGRRGDGAEIQSLRGLKEVAKNAPDAYPLPDWKVQILNALEGGPSPTYFQEANANASQLRGLKVNPFEDTESANPFWNKLKSFGDKLKLNETDIRGTPIETMKVGNILEAANETIRLDRVKSIEEKPVDVPTSTYFNRSIGFSPNVAKRNPIGIDETTNPNSLVTPYRLQGLAAARGYDNAHKK